jgi:acetylornithine/N-succinyldiaminopimelate aminotransferase
MKCRMANTAVLAAVIDAKLLAVTAGDNVLRLLPPLTVTDEELREATARIRTAAAALAARAGEKVA